jgi:hypothetical protein
MGTYGRNFEFRITPTEEERHGRVYFDGANAVPIGVPLVVAANATPSVMWTDALPSTLATGAQPFKRGLCGIGVYEHIDFNGFDPSLTLYSDIDLIPTKRLVQLTAGPNTKVVFTNTTARTFMGVRPYPARMMVAGMGATPTVKVGDLLSPGTGTDAAGYWAVNATAANAWLVVTNVDAARQMVEAEFAV